MATAPLRLRDARKLVAKVQLVPRSCVLLVKAVIAVLSTSTRSTPVAKKSYLSVLRDPSSDVWTRRFAILRRPYLHLYERSDELNEVSVINASAVRVESSPEVEAMLSVRPV